MPFTVRFGSGTVVLGVPTPPTYAYAPPVWPSKSAPQLPLAQEKSPRQLRPIHATPAVWDLPLSRTTEERAPLNGRVFASCQTSPSSASACDVVYVVLAPFHRPV